jgi:surface carbohydrate biosynthesis protein (TIGR04326 family)
MPLPYRVALNGSAAMNKFVAGGYPRSSLVEVEALRYLYLENSTDIGAATSLMKFNPKLRLLVLGDYLASSTRRQMSLLATALQFREAEIEVTVKPHPACPIDPNDYPSLGMRLELRPICELLEQCDAAYTSGNTSAALDSYCYGVPIVTILDPTMLNMSPLRGYEGVYYVSTPDELREFFRSTKRSYRPIKNTGALLTIDPDLPRWRALLNTREKIEA